MRQTGVYIGSMMIYFISLLMHRFDLLDHSIAIEHVSERIGIASGDKLNQRSMQTAQAAPGAQDVSLNVFILEYCRSTYLPS
jgi:hypothetical protein